MFLFCFQEATDVSKIQRVQGNFVVHVVNAYGSTLGEKEDHVGDSTTEVFVRHHSGNILSSVWNSKS